MGDPGITDLLGAVGRGEAGAADRLYSIVYDDLKDHAERQLRGLPSHASLQPTALVAEAYLRLFGAEQPAWANRRHFYFASARAMRDIIVETIRRRGALKRGGNWSRVKAGELPDDAPETHGRILAVDEALRHLAEHDPRSAQVTLLRFFGGLTHEQVAATLDVSVATARREWAYAQAWLRRRIEHEAV